MPPLPAASTDFVVHDNYIVHHSPASQDRDTSGIMVLGFGARNHRSLSIQFQDRKVFKVYQALVSGHIQVMMIYPDRAMLLNG